MILHSVHSSKLSSELERLLASGQTGELILDVTPCIAKASRSSGSWATFSAQTSGFQLARDQITAFLQSHGGSIIEARWDANLVQVRLDATALSELAELDWVSGVRKH